MSIWLDNSRQLGIQQEKNRIVIARPIPNQHSQYFAVGDLVDGHMTCSLSPAEAVMAKNCW